MFDEFPYHQSILHTAEAEYEELPGFDDEIGDCRRERDLPREARDYLELISDYVGAPVRLVGVGPGPRPGGLARRGAARPRLRRRRRAAELYPPPPCSEKVLVANRGEIAIRVMRTLKEMGIVSVGVYSEADRDAPHVREADEAYLLGPPPPAESYLAVDEDRSRPRSKSGAEAIHPGYGFLAENAEFAAACEKAGLVFIGPPAEAIEAMGSKTRARELMSEAGVPIVPGTTAPVDDAAEAAKKAAAIGYPVACKAAGGGGGKGFRVAAVRGRARGRVRGRGARGREVLLRPDRSTSSATSRTRATSRSRCSPTRTATWSTSASATARSSAATRS